METTRELDTLSVSDIATTYFASREYVDEKIQFFETRQEALDASLLYPDALMLFPAVDVEEPGTNNNVITFTIDGIIPNDSYYSYSTLELPYDLGMRIFSEYESVIVSVSFTSNLFGNINIFTVGGQNQISQYGRVRFKISYFNPEWVSDMSIYFYNDRLLFGFEDDFETDTISNITVTINFTEN